MQTSSDIDIEEEDLGCLGAPTEAQMWEQQVALVQAEYEQVSAELRHARANIAKLIEMNAATEAQRNEALRLIKSHRRDLSAAHVEISALGIRYRRMLMAERQRAESPSPLPSRCPLCVMTDSAVTQRASAGPPMLRAGQRRRIWTRWTG